MKPILFLAHRIPYPPDRGDKIRSFNIVSRLSKIAPVHIAAFADDAVDAAHAEGLRDAMKDGLASLRIVTRRRSRAVSLAAALATGCSVSTSAFASAEMRRHVADMLHDGHVGGIFAFSGQMGQYVPVDRNGIRFVMDFVDVDSAKFDAYAQDASVPLAWLYSREARLLAREEAAIAARADVSTFVSGSEARLFRDGTRQEGDKVRVLGNGVDLSYFDPNATFASLDRTAPEPLIVFVGQMDYAPNVAAVEHFARAVLPIVHRATLHARFAIVGRNPSPVVRSLAALPGVDVIGTVPDTRPWLAAADVVVAPLRIARGVQNKVLEAMAMARPAVVSPAAFEGIDAEDGRHLLVADGPDSTAAAISSILDIKAFASALGAAARTRMCACYSWDRQLAALPGLIRA